MKKKKINPINALKRFTISLKTILILFGMMLTIQVHAQSKKSSVIKVKTSAECEQCKKKIESNLIYNKGVKFCRLDIPSKEVTVTYNPEKTNPEAIKLAISKLGYDADDVKADSLEYIKLPECCKKGGIDHK